MKKEIDYMNFQTPYSTCNRIKRMIWTICWTLLARPFPKSVLNSWKRFLLVCFGAKMAKTAKVYSSAKIFMPWNLEMKDHACIGSDVDCYNAAKITIGINATISNYAYLCTASHNINSANHEQLEKPITIGDRAWVASGAYIGPGVNIGEGAVVGAMGCVYKDIEPWVVVGGNPARKIKDRIIGNQ